MKELSMHIMDIVQNSVRAGAKHVTVEITEDAPKKMISFSIKDDGCGMTKEFVEKLCDPFTTSRNTRKVGLGIPMLMQTCEQCGGKLIIESAVNKGTFIKAEMHSDNIDLPPMGNIEESVYLLILMDPGVVYTFIYNFNDKQYVLDMAEVLEILGDVPLDSPDISEWLKSNIAEGISEIKS